MLARSCLAASVLVFLAIGMPSVQAQPAFAATSGTTEAQLGPTDFLSAALRVVSAVDSYEMAAVWDVSSPIMKASVPRDRFIANVAQKRAMLGRVASRDWGAIMRVAVGEAEGGLPPGRYISVRFRTVGQSGAVLEEVISFHLDIDAQWKLAGYTLLAS